MAPSIFGQYDNDGPTAFPTPATTTATSISCRSSIRRRRRVRLRRPIWSHRWSLTGCQYNGNGTGPYTTNDARTGGGYIIIDDYTIQPIKNCDNAT
jgi:hypothetical protein